MPYNQKMICVASKGDYLRPNLLQRLPPFGVGSLYAYAPDGENRSPDTYPIHLDELLREDAKKNPKGTQSNPHEVKFVRKIRGSAKQEEMHAFHEIEERGYGDSQIFVKDAEVTESEGKIVDLRQAEQPEELGSIIQKEPALAEVFETQQFSSSTENIQEECTSVQPFIEEAEETRISSATDVVDDDLVTASGQESEKENAEHTISSATDVIDDGLVTVSGQAPEKENAEHTISSATDVIDDGLVTVSGQESEKENAEHTISSATDVIDDGLVTVSGQAPAEKSGKHTIPSSTDVIDQGELRVKHLNPAARPERKLTLIQGGASAKAAEEAERASMQRKELRHSESLGSLLVGVVKQLAKTGARYQSTELKFLAGTMGETARVFFNSSMQRESDSVSIALDQMQSVWQELSQLSQGENKARYEALNLALADAICVFRRECKNPDPAAAAVAVAVAA